MFPPGTRIRMLPGRTPPSVDKPRKFDSWEGQEGEITPTKYPHDKNALQHVKFDCGEYWWVKPEDIEAVDGMLPFPEFDDFTPVHGNQAWLAPNEKDS